MLRLSALEGVKTSDHAEFMETSLHKSLVLNHRTNMQCANEVK